eukprot:COSAG01_NODE_30516_length_614_cov_1.504854_1_plen_139_part_10
MCRMRVIAVAGQLFCLLSWANPQEVQLQQQCEKSSGSSSSSSDDAAVAATAAATAADATVVSSGKISTAVLIATSAPSRAHTSYPTGDKSFAVLEAFPAQGLLAVEQISPFLLAHEWGTATKPIDGTIAEDPGPPNGSQ